MSVKLDWDIESEQGKHREHKEDGASRRARYVPFLRLFLMILFVALLVAGVFAGAYWRYVQVNAQIEDLLRDTVAAEVAALRIGNLDQFITIQRSASDDWLRTQQATFNAYQQLKVGSDITLTGDVSNMAIDGQRGRVQVQEIIDGVPYTQTWFYWRYDDGWRHVPPDYTFWGSSQTLENEQVIIRYQSVDAPIARAMQTQVTRWLDDACRLFVCSDIPPIRIEIVPNDLPNVGWENVENWSIVVSSPYRDRARTDMPFDRQYQIDAATLLANRLVDHMMPVQAVYPTDAHFLRSSVVAWLVGRFVQINPETHLLQSIVNTYGIESLATLLNNLQATSDIGVLTRITNTATIADTSLDWRDFVKWRLTTEDDLIQNADEVNWRRLYDLNVGNINSIAYGRYTANSTPISYNVLGTSVTTNADGQPQLQARVQVQYADSIREELVLFNLVDGTWLRAS